MSTKPALVTVSLSLARCDSAQLATDTLLGLFVGAGHKSLQRIMRQTCKVIRGKLAHPVWNSVLICYGAPSAVVRKAVPLIHGDGAIAPLKCGSRETSRRIRIVLNDEIGIFSRHVLREVDSLGGEID